MYCKHSFKSVSPHEGKMHKNPPIPSLEILPLYEELFLADILRDPKMNQWVSLPSMILQFYTLGRPDMGINNYKLKNGKCPERGTKNVFRETRSYFGN